MGVDLMGRTLERGTDSRSLRRAVATGDSGRRAIQPFVVVVAVVTGDDSFGEDSPVAPAAAPPGASSHSGVGCGGWMSTVGRSVSRSLGSSIGMSRLSVPAFAKENVTGIDWP